MAQLLESSSDNPCFGCGPAHPHGLRLAFARDGEAVVGTLVAREDLQGAVDRLHSGFLYMALLEACNWGAFGLTAKMGVPIRTGPFAPKRWVRVGERIGLRATMKGPTTVLAEARAEDGALLASVEREYEFPDEAGFLKRMGYDKLPEAYGGSF